MSGLPYEARPYRKCVGIMLLNGAGEVFVGRRIDTPGDNWQMPQGGIDLGESPRDAAFRELEEETGTRAAVIVAEYPDWLRYDLPRPLCDRVWGGRYRGQMQRWFAMRFLGQDEDIRLDAHTPEFSEWQWVAMERLPALIVPFKRPAYHALVDAFGHLAVSSRARV